MNTLRKWFFPGLITLLSGSAMAASISNKDVLSLIESGMPEEIIVQAIKGGEQKLDTSAGALIKLKEKGATAAVLSAMLGKGSSRAASDTSPSKQSDSGRMNPEEVAIVIDGKESNMQYMIPGTRTAARAFGLGGMASYAVLQGEKATRRLETTTPEFIVSVPKNAQPINYLTLASFAVRKNSTREVMTGGGYMSYSSGINKDRIIPVTFVQDENQSRAKDGFVLYRVKPEQGMASGEYALVLYTSEVRTAGFFSQAANSYYDFGIN